jgi:uncharacterized protein YjbJ (UPF0337 family)
MVGARVEAALRIALEGKFPSSLFDHALAHVVVTELAPALGRYHLCTPRIAAGEFSMSDNLQGTAREMGGRVQRKVGEAVGDAKTQADGLYNQAAGTAQQMWGQAQEATDQVSGAIRAQPLIAAAVAVGIGYILGRLTA